MCLFVYVVDHGVNEGEAADEPRVNEDQLCDPEPEGQYLDQDFLEDFEDGKFNPIIWCMFCPSFINTTYRPIFKTAYCFAVKTRLDSHPLICYDHSLTT